MASGITHPTTPPATADTLKNWIMVVLTLVFISAVIASGPQLFEKKIYDVW